MGWFDKFAQHINDTMLPSANHLEEAELNEDGSLTLHISQGDKQSEHTLTPEETRNLFRRWENKK